MYATEQYKKENEAERRILTVSTASAYKFAADVYTSLTGNKPSDELGALDMLKELTGEPIPSPLEGLGSKEALHTSVIEKSEMMDSVSNFAKNS